MQLLLTLVFLGFALCYSKPHPERRELSDIDHFADDPENHNIQFDHEAFLGKTLAAEFDQLPQEESKERLSQIFDKIDSDSNGKLSETELRRWIAYVAKTSLRLETQKHWKNLNQNKNEPLGWKDYLERNYGIEDEILSDPTRRDTYISMKRNDELRWNAADMDHDSRLSLEEYAAFLQPQDFPRMRKVVIGETLQSIDKDKDGYISIDEYLADLARSHDGELDLNKPEPEWAIKERDQFKRYRDKDGDGRMNSEEVGEWIMPTDYDPIESESKHLIYHSDVDKDDLLSRQEVIDHYDLFVGSQALNYGRSLGHEEL